MEYRSSRRLRAGIGLGAGAIIAVAAWLAGPAGAGAALAMAGLGAIAEHLLRRGEALPDASPVPATEARLRHAHAITGLPTREPLLAQIAAADRGQLGIIEFNDYDRLHAFDEGFAQRVLRAFADRLARMTSGHSLLAQVDRARFAIWFEDDGARFPALVYAAGSEIEVDGERLIPALSHAVVGFPQDADTPGALLNRAYAALGHGETSDPLVTARECYGLEQDLRQAIARQELSLEFQPLVDAAARRVCGAEALLRWHHPVRGPIPPTQFIPAMESAGLAHEIGNWVLDRALREARGWAAEGLCGLRIAINVSGQQLDRTGLADAVARALARHGLDASALEIELTETTATGALGQQLFDRLRALGVAIAIDDFGTGFSSLSTLRTLRFDKIKIDREFVTLVDQRRDSQAICRSILALGHGLGIGVLAEGVERAEEFAWLRRHGCTLYQGYYFARPLSPQRFRDRVNDRVWLAARLDDDARTERLRA